jgi:hypothetical protein
MAIVPVEADPNAEDREMVELETGFAVVPDPHGRD